MSDIATPRYGYEPRAAFAATRAFASRDTRRAPGPAAARRRTLPRSLLRRLGVRRGGQ